MPNRKLPPNPDNLNQLRSATAMLAIESFAKTGMGELIGGSVMPLLEQNLTDLLCNIGHLCDREGFSLTNCFHKAQYQYAAETDREGSQFALGVEPTPQTPLDPFDDPRVILRTLVADLYTIKGYWTEEIDNTVRDAERIMAPKKA